MKSLIFTVFCLFIANLTVVLAGNICYTGKCVNSETCEFKEELCQEGSSCMTTVEEFICLGNISHSFAKRCAQPLYCNVTILSQANMDVLVRSSVQCCKGDRCNSGKFDLPPLEIKPQGGLCPFCYAFNTTEGCDAKVKIPCLEKDAQCVRFRGSMKPPGGKELDFSAQGCSSKSACELRFTHLVGLQIIKKEEITCYDPPSLPSYSLIEELVGKLLH